MGHCVPGSASVGRGRGVRNAGGLAGAGANGSLRAAPCSTVWDALRCARLSHETEAPWREFRAFHCRSEGPQDRTLNHEADRAPKVPFARGLRGSETVFSQAEEREILKRRSVGRCDTLRQRHLQRSPIVYVLEDERPPAFESGTDVWVVTTHPLTPIFRASNSRAASSASRSSSSIIRQILRQLE